MFSDIKFNASMAPKDHNGSELEMGNTVFYETYWGVSGVGVIVGITKNEKYLWIGNGLDMFKRMPKNVILIKNPEKTWVNDKH